MFLGLTNINNETAAIEAELRRELGVERRRNGGSAKLREDAVWSDGTPVTAHDVVYSVKRVVKPETASPYAYVLYIIQNAKAINQATDGDIETLGVTALDDYTVQFTLEAPAAYSFLSPACGPCARCPRRQSRNLATLGPTRLISWSTGHIWSPSETRARA